MVFPNPKPPYSDLQSGNKPQGKRCEELGGEHQRTSVTCEWALMKATCSIWTSTAASVHGCDGGMQSRDRGNCILKTCQFFKSWRCDPSQHFIELRRKQTPHCTAENGSCSRNFKEIPTLRSFMAVRYRHFVMFSTIHGLLMIKWTNFSETYLIYLLLSSYISHSPCPDACPFTASFFFSFFSFFLVQPEVLSVSWCFTTRGSQWHCDAWISMHVIFTKRGTKVIRVRSENYRGKICLCLVATLHYSQ